jgi:hypothetical protein
MFEDYLRDAHRFFGEAEAAANDRSDKNARTYYRASVFCSFAAIEAFVNYVGDSFAKGDSLPKHETAFLNDKAIYFSTDKFLVLEKTEFHKLDDKLRVIIRRFVAGFDFKSVAWANLMDFKKFRNSLVHPREIEDETLLTDYRAKIRKGLSGVIEVMSTISKGVYKKPLRKQLLDLIPD